MNTKAPTPNLNKHASAPKAGVGKSRKPMHLRGFSAPNGRQHCLPHCLPQPGPFLREPGLSKSASRLAPRPASSPLHVKRPCGEVYVEGVSALGVPLGLREVALMIGCSPWTVRQTLIPRGLPVFRSAASGKLIFYTDQVVRWIESQQ